MSDTINKSICLRVEKIPRPKDSARSVYIFKCALDGCETEIRVRSDALKNHSYLCASHSHRKRPFESIYNRLSTDWRKIEVELTYDEFLEFTKIKNCHYCNDSIPWVEYATIRGKYTSSAYFLDRKDAKLCYTKNNLVVCCTDCNFLKGARFTYDEFMLLAPMLRKIREARI